jgi:hypothetical protein
MKTHISLMAAGALLCAGCANVDAQSPTATGASQTDVSPPAASTPNAQPAQHSATTGGNGFRVHVDPVTGEIVSPPAEGLTPEMRAGEAPVPAVRETPEVAPQEQPIPVPGGGMMMAVPPSLDAESTVVIDKDGKAQIRCDRRDAPH